MRLRHLLVLASLGTALLVAGPSQAVVGGAPDEDHPYVGLVQTPLGLCSGALVSPTLFVTAAHCFPPGGAFVAVRVGQSVSGATPFTIGLGSAHPGFQPSGGGLPGVMTNDVAVVTLMAPVYVDRYASLPGAGAASALGRKAEVTVVGFGFSAFDGRFPVAPLTRRSADVEVVDRNGVGSDSHLRLSPKGADPCFGDSGGPNLMAGTDIILAVTSFSTNGRCQGGYAYRLDTPAAMDFLADFTP